MYAIYADGQLLHAPHLVQEGCGVFSPTLTVELNKAGSLEYTMPPTNTLYNSVSKLKSVITVFYKNEEIFRGRVLHDEKDFYKQKKVYCEGELAFLLDSQQRPYTGLKTAKNLLEMFLTNHNERVEAAKRFVLGDVTVSGKNSIKTFTNDDYNSTLGEIEDKLLNTYGGYLRTRKVGNERYLDWLADYGSESTQTIEFGRNLLDITEHITAEDIFTVIIPLGKTVGDSKKKLTIESVNNSKDYLENQTAINLFGRIEKKNDWSDIDNATELKTLAQTELNANIAMSVTLTVKAMDLHLLDVNVDRLKLGDKVQVISIPHGLNSIFMCTKITYNLESPDQTEYVFGVTFKSLTDKQIDDKKGISKTIAIVQSVEAAADRANEAAENANSVIETLPETYITGEQLEESLSQKNYLTQDSLNQMELVTENTLTQKNYVTQTQLNEAISGAIEGSY